DLNNNSALVVHIIPEASTKLDNYVDLKKAEQDQNLDVFSPTKMGGFHRGNVIYNMDGIMVFYESSNNNLSSYTQLFHDVSLEATEVRLINQINDVVGKIKIYYCEKFEKL